MWQRSKNLYHLCIALIASVIHRFPGKKLTVIGVTGTDGKTTTTNLIYHILQTAEKHVSMISTINAVISGKEYDTGFHVTTPSPLAVQKFLSSAVQTLRKSEEPQFMVLEVTSHAIDQNRIFGIDFTYAVLTNITNEHLDYHKTYENYARTKIKLLKKAKIAIVNKDDRSYHMVRSALEKEKIKFITYGFGKESDINPKVFPFKTNLIGEFNTYNCLAAAAVCRHIGIPDKIIRKALASFKLPVGRAEIIYNKDFTVMVDFAHTPNAIGQLLSSVKPLVKKRLIHVFGSAGQRDHLKRPEMGTVSSQYADVIILTAEDPRTESVEEINSEIESGIKNKESRMKNRTLLKFADRKKAIEQAIAMAKIGDIIVITGKGHEQSINYGQGEIPWSDQEVVKEILYRK